MSTYRCTESDYANLLLVARLRRERRLREAAAVAALWPEPRAQRAVDLLHEATRTVWVLEQRLDDHRQSMAEGVWEQRLSDGWLG